GAARKWPGMPVVFELNRRGTIEISDGSDLAAARAAFATWDAIANSSLAFLEDPMGLSDRDGFVDMHNTVVWIENATDPRLLVDAPAVTGVMTDPATGNITEADVVLNAVNFSWTASGTG